MPSTPISEHPDLTPVFGPLADGDRDRIFELLDEADHRMAEIHEELAAQGPSWKADGVVLTTEVSGQASIDLLLEEERGRLTFAGQLRPRNFFPTEDEMWQPGRPPLVMATDAWDVDGAVSVRFKTRVGGRPFTIQEHVEEIEERRYESAAIAAEAFARLCTKLARLARSREPTVEAWKPNIE
jgi:hypothetical protein